jgi:hypothetical protein
VGARGVGELLVSGKHQKPAPCRAIGKEDVAAECDGFTTHVSQRNLLCFHISTEKLRVCIITVCPRVQFVPRIRG